MKKHLPLMIIVLICAVSLSTYSYFLVRSACAFGYQKGYEKGVTDNNVIQKLQESVDRINATDSVTINLPSPNRDTVVLLKDLNYE